MPNTTIPQKSVLPACLIAGVGFAVLSWPIITGSSPSSAGSIALIFAGWAVLVGIIARMSFSASREDENA